ncbi:class F sortase [Streptomyces sp. NPDC046237]|uniref:class F sortase n=1 Tax=Streptomyces sp. NPDC046237 TaxID=3154914 RepID=UPI0033E569D3
MARRRFRSTRRQRRLLRLTRTVVVTLSLVGGGIWWAQDDEPSGLPAAAADRAASEDAAAHGAPAQSTARPAPGRQPDEKPEAQSPPEPAPKPGPKVAPKPARPLVASPPPLTRSRATSIAVPSITIEAPVIDLGLDRSGKLATPPIENPRIVGWYAGGPAPGERGTAIVVGHRDTRTGPAIFLNLDSLDRGNTVRIARADGKVAVFTVDKVRTYTKKEFPDREVYGSTDRPELRLLTCGGSFDPKKGYESNVVVFAHLTDVAKEF